MLFHIEGFLTLTGQGSEADEQLRVGAGIGRNVGSGVRVRADITWQRVGFNLLGPADHVYLRLRVFQGWLRGLTAADG